MSRCLISVWIACLAFALCATALVQSFQSPAAHLRTQAGELHLNAAVAAFRQGQTAATSGRRGEAEADFRLAMEIEPTYLDAYHALIDLYFAERRPDQAGAAMTRLLQIDPRDTAVREQLARLLEEQKQWMTALAQYSLLLNTRPQDREILYHFALCAGQAHLTEQVRAAVRRGLALDPADRRFRQLKEQFGAAASAGEAKAQPGGTKQR